MLAMPTPRTAHCLPFCRSGAGSSAGKAEGASTVTVEAAAVDCGLALWFAGGTAFQSELMTAKDSAQDELLQVRSNV